MSAYTRKDMNLLQEAYNVRLLREQAPHMTLSQLEQRLELMSESELNYINTVMERVLNEFWGQQALAGLKNVGKAAVGGAQRAMGGAAQKVADVGRGAAQKAANVGRGALAAGKAGAQQVASNVGNIYQKGAIQQRQSTALDKGLKAIEQLRGFIQQAENDGVLQKGGQKFEDMSISELIEYLQMNKEVSASNSQRAMSQGFTKGAGGAMKQAYSQQQGQ